MEKRFYKERELAEMLGRSIHTLRRDRFENKGIPYVRLGRQILYPAARVERYLEKHLVDPEGF